MLTHLCVGPFKVGSLEGGVLTHVCVGPFLLYHWPRKVNWSACVDVRCRSPSPCMSCVKYEGGVLAQTCVGPFRMHHASIPHVESHCNSIHQIDIDASRIDSACRITYKRLKGAAGALVRRALQSRFTGRGRADARVRWALPLVPLALG